MPRQPHIIRLRDPWQWVAGTASGAPGARVERWFNRPTRLEPSTRVVLVVAGIPALRRVLLNGKELAGPGTSGFGTTWRIEISHQLERRNLLELVFDAIASANTTTLRKALATGHVRLEI